MPDGAAKREAIGHLEQAGRAACEAYGGGT
jgi:hypothetical protein